MTPTTTAAARITRTALRTGIASFVVLGAAACGDLDIVNTNAPTVETLTNAPGRAVLARAASGVYAQTNNDVGGTIQSYALYGREGYNLQGNDARETFEQIRGPQDPTGRNGGLWTGTYNAIRTINSYLTALETGTGLSDAEIRSSQGFAKTMKAYHLYRLAIRTGALGIPIDVDQPITAEPAPFVSFSVAMEAASALADAALADLQAGGSAFPFTSPSGFAGFNTPATFAQFNRALAAKILIHRATFNSCSGCWAQATTALEASFLTTAGLPEALSTGVYYTYSAAANEPTNPVTEPIGNDRFWVHPSIVTGVQLKANGEPDDRFTNKVTDAGRTRTLNELSGTHKPTMFNSASNREVANLGSNLPWIINEELILLRAEARWNTGNKDGAIADINLVRTNAGGLPAAAVTAGSSDDAFVTELLYNRLYSLMWTQGTRWLDARRYNRLSSLPIDRPGDSVFPNMLVPSGECDARSLATPCTPL